MRNAANKPNLNLLLISASLLLATLLSASAQAEVRTYEASDSISQFVRDNAPDYWAWNKTHAKEYFGKLADQEGIVIGDAHPGNFIFSKLNGKMKFFIMDIKDAGKGSFIVDIAHQIMATNVVLKEGDADIEKATEKQLEAYLLGLTNKEYKIHDDIKWIFETSGVEFDRKVGDYVTDKTKDDHFKYKTGMIEPLENFVRNSKLRSELKAGIQAAVRKSLPGSKVLDFAYRPRERGGSKNLKRYWALVDSKGERMILEFKEIEAPAVAQYSKQLSASKRFDLVMKTLWGVNDPLYQAVEIDGKPFWMRPKKIDVFDIPYQQNNEDDEKFLRHIATYEAYLMGRYHGKQLKGKQFADEIEHQSGSLAENINSMSNDYIERLTEKVNQLKKDQ